MHTGPDLLLDAANNRLLEFVRLAVHGFGAAITCLYIAETDHAQQVRAISAHLADIRREMQDMAQFETRSGGVITL